MSGKIKIIAVIAATAIISSTATWLTKDIIEFERKINMTDISFDDKMNAVDTILESRYLYNYDKNELGEKAIKAYVEALNEPYTHYYSADEFASYIGNIQDGYVGIGIIVSVNENNQIVVIAPTENSPAYEAGILPMDILKAVDGVEYNGDKLSEAVSHIKGGKEGTTVNLTLIRNNAEYNVTVARKNITTSTVNGEILENNIGYIRITQFDMQSESGEVSTYSEFKSEFEKLQKNGMTKLIIDLRDNPGGVLTETCEIADYLLPEGVITYTETKDGTRKYYNSESSCVDMPIAVLINGSSASASEVLTGALKDYGKAVIIGTKSFGKGIVQDVYPFTDGSGISMTSAKYYTPNGICIHGTGIEPDISIDLPDELKDYYISTLEHDKDTQLQKALEVIREK